MVRRTRRSCCFFLLVFLSLLIATAQPRPCAGGVERRQLGGRGGHRAPPPLTLLLLDLEWAGPLPLRGHAHPCAVLRIPAPRRVSARRVDLDGRGLWVPLAAPKALSPEAEPELKGLGHHAHQCGRGEGRVEDTRTAILW